MDLTASGKADGVTLDRPTTLQSMNNLLMLVSSFRSKSEMENGNTGNEQIGVALFGLGRAGHIHFENLRKFYRCRLLYLVETEVNRALETCEKYFMKDVKVLAPEDASNVYADPR